MTNQATATTAPQPLLATLAERGWARHVVKGTEADTVASELDRLGDLLGTRTAGRAGALEEVVRPQAANIAHPRSLSARYGLSVLPFHTELSHRLRPCRYLLLGCIDPGSSNTATMLLNWRSLGFSSEELRLLEDAPILVRTGRRSFYSTILSPDRAFLCYDQLWASLALELLGKAALARKHPCLVVDPTHWQSLFVAAGVKVTTDVKTITAKTLFQRLVHFVARFDSKIQVFCEEIAERRNAELHSADLPFRTMKLDAWEARYWHACDTILSQMGSSLEQWLGAADAKAPRELLDEAAAALDAAIKLRVEAAKEHFGARKKPERERSATEAALREPQEQVALFKGNYDEIWVESCPACKCRAFMTGMQTGNPPVFQGRCG